MRARQSAERELLDVKEVLEQRSRELAESLALTRATLEGSFDGILATDQNGHITAYNEKFQRLWLIPPELMQTYEHRSVLEACARQFPDPDAFLARVAEIQAMGSSQSADTLELADGRIYERISTIQYIDGREVGRVWSVRDVTARRQAEAQLRAQNEWFKTTLASIGDAVITTDLRSQVTFMNPVAERMTGWSATEALGSPVDRICTLVKEHADAQMQHPVDRVLHEDTMLTLANQSALLTRDGQHLCVEGSAAPMRDTNGQLAGAVMVFRDVSPRRRAEAALLEADRRKDEFLATLAHELRNPLAPIRQAALISKAPSASEAQKRWSHDVIDRQVQHMSLLLDDLLDISRVTRGRLVLRRQPTDLAAAIDAAVETARPLIDAKRHRLTVRSPTEPIRFLADPLRVAQVLSNLLTNAAKYTDPGGQIVVAAHCDRAEVVIEVSDTGIGISSEALPRVFDMSRPAQVERATARKEDWALDSR